MMILIIIRLSIFLNEKDEKGQDRRPILRDLVDNQERVLSERDHFKDRKDMKVQDKLEYGRKMRADREKIARIRAGKAQSVGFEDMFALHKSGPSEERKLAVALDKDTKISKEGDVMMKARKSAVATKTRKRNKKSIMAETVCEEELNESEESELNDEFKSVSDASKYDSPGESSESEIETGTSKKRKKSDKKKRKRAANKRRKIKKSKANKSKKSKASSKKKKDGKPRKDYTQSSYKIAKDKRRREHPSTCIPNSKLDNLVCREEFGAHLKDCVKDIREIGDEARLEGSRFFTGFLDQYNVKPNDPNKESFGTFSHVIKDLKSFSIVFYNNDPDTRRSEFIAELDDDSRTPLRDILMRLLFRTTRLEVSLKFPD
jgi:hypothetical protein